jgi:hypothetical protein
VPLRVQLGIQFRLLCRDGLELGHRRLERRGVVFLPFQHLGQIQPVVEQHGLEAVVVADRIADGIERLGRRLILGLLRRLGRLLLERLDLLAQ